MILLGVDHNWVLLILWFHCHLYVGFMVFSCLLVWAASDIASFFWHCFFLVFFWFCWSWYASFFLFFHVPLFEWLLTFIGTVILWRPLQLRGHWFARGYISFLPFRKKETLFDALFLLFHTALESWFVFCTLNLCCFFFFVGHKFSLYWFICCDALLIYWASHGNKMKMTTSTDKTMQLLN